MPRFSVKDLLRGITLAAIGFAMLAPVWNGAIQPTTYSRLVLQAFLIVFGGMFVAYGLTFPIKYPQYRYMLALAGIFAAQAWFSGLSVGLLVFLGLAYSFLAVCRYYGNRPTQRNE